VPVCVQGKGKRRGVTLGMHRGGVFGYSLRGIDDVVEGRSGLRRFVVWCGGDTSGYQVLSDV
jgi:hypothetical protein